MTLCSKCNKVSVSRNEINIQIYILLPIQYTYYSTTCKNELHIKCYKMNAKSLHYMKAKGLAHVCEDCTKKLKQNRRNGTLIKNISQPIPKGNSDTTIYTNSDLDTRVITTRLDELIKNQTIYAFYNVSLHRYIIRKLNIVLICSILASKIN